MCDYVGDLTFLNLLKNGNLIVSYLFIFVVEKFHISVL